MISGLWDCGASKDIWGLVRVGRRAYGGKILHDCSAVEFRLRACRTKRWLHDTWKALKSTT